MAALSEYELQRLEHIKRNQEFLARLGLVPLSSQPEMAAAESPEKKQVRGMTRPRQSFGLRSVTTAEKSCAVLR